jgi:signal transduction histidine kinase
MDRSDLDAEDEERCLAFFTHSHVPLLILDIRELQADVARLCGGGSIREDDHLPFKIMRANASAMNLLGVCSESELVGSLDRVIPGALVKRSVFLRAAQSDTSLEGQARVQRLDGGALNAVFRVVFPPQSTLNRAVIALVDVTQGFHASNVAGAKAELDRLFRAAAVDGVSASIVHEINQPLGAMMINAQTALRVLKQADGVPESAIAAIGRTLANIEQITAIVQRVGLQMTTRFKPLAMSNLTSVLQEALQIMRSELDENDVRTHVSITDVLPDVAMDKTELLQVMVNLIRNAVQAMFETPRAQRRLTITAEQADDHLKMTVSDSGSGFPSHIQPQMFEMFFTTKPNGVGLGLSICKSIVEGRGGRLVAHAGLNGGATFSMALPIASGPEALSASEVSRH